ncbi:MAG: tRNA 2-thiocytidine biosynthesis protein TtcA [Clostridia bacterium]|nr:tRNA 2-thiocytidine biosynthesis protein TtcA [Clostridia bacterium]
MQKILSPMRRAIQDYNMIEDGDRIFVGLSGGKDSILLVSALAAYQRFSPEHFTLEAITIDMGMKETDRTVLAKMTEYCESLGVKHHIVKTDIAEIIFDARKESNPCSLCAKMRRGALNNEINRLGGGKLALGHNADDVAETMLLSLLYEGRFSCFAPTAYMDKSGVSLIRPLIYIEEYDIKAAVERLGLPILKNPCPANHNTKREYAKNLIKQLGNEVPNAKQSILGAIYHPERMNLWDAPCRKDEDDTSPKN